MDTPLELMKAKLKEVQLSQAECVNELGVVKTMQRERYNILVKQATEFKAGIDQWEKWVKQGWFDKKA